MYLSKSLYTRGLQCTKSLWLKTYKQEVLEEPSEATRAVFAVGNEVGKLACRLFAGGKTVAFDKTDYGVMIQETQQLLDSGIPYIYEASFIYDGIFVAVDILKVNDDKSVEIYEVKSSSYKSDTKKSEIMKYIHDASIQYYVLDALGYTVAKTALVLLNGEYVRGKTLELDKLFVTVDVSHDVKRLQADIPKHLQTFQNVLNDTQNEPDADIGKHCHHPYVCDAKEYCWRRQRNIPAYSVFNLFRLGSKKQQALYEKGIINIEDIPDDFAMTDTQKRKATLYKRGETVVDKEAIRAFLDTLRYPVYHLDFETFQQAVPRWEGVSPYMHIPFQYSLHIQHADGRVEHREFLAKEVADPRYALAERLVADIPADVTVLAYNISFEKGIIKKLAQSFEEFREHLTAIHDNIKDLMTPFSEGSYYLPQTNGSNSVKSVLPALVPHMANTYKELEGVQNGGDAMRLFPQLGVSITDKEEITKARERLLAYCKLDTLAMVEILKKLEESVK